MVEEKQGTPVVVVTGAGRGMGLATANAFAARGDRVVFVDRTDRALRVADEAGDHALGIVCDVTDEGAVVAAFDQIADRLGTVDVLANFAGATVKTPSPSHLTSEADWSTMVDSNLKGTFFCCRSAIRIMLENGGGRIINISSNAGRTSSPVLGVAYTASKAGVIGLTRHLALEYAGKNILVNTIAPGPADTPRLSELLKPDQIAGLTSRIPLGRLTDPMDVAELVMYLASDKASFITGATIDVNGGFVMV
jgi:NAD(P)-dependent dehydrogenase (short-subunit alcohol dehydrogenase family)